MGISCWNVRISSIRLTSKIQDLQCQLVRQESVLRCWRLPRRFAPRNDIVDGAKNSSYRESRRAPLPRRAAKQCHPERPLGSRGIYRAIVRPEDPSIRLRLTRDDNFREGQDPPLRMGCDIDGGTGAVHQLDKFKFCELFVLSL